jgi:hypothetical protein
MAGALLATLAITAWVAAQPDVEPVPAATPRAASADRSSSRAPAGASAQPSAQVLSLPVTARALVAWSDPPEVALLSWGPPPAPPPPSEPVKPVQRPVAAARVVPTAPAFPYALIGRFDDGHGPQALLVSPLRTVNAKANDVIDGQWRVDQVLPNSMTLTWLPGNLQQTLNDRPS